MQLRRLTRFWIPGFIAGLALLHPLNSQEQPAPSIPPDHPELKPYLQLWLTADALPLKDSAPVYRWPDRSGHGRDAFPNAGVHQGAGTPPHFAANSMLNSFPAVRFEAGNGLATAGDKPVQIHGDAPFTLVLVAALRRQESPTSDVLLGFGEAINPANASPDRPGAALLQLDRGPNGRHRLDHAGGFTRDALIGRPGSFASFYEMPLVITLVKSPGPMRDTSAIYINGEPIDSAPASGITAAPDIRHRQDFDVILGHAFNETGSISGDVSEALIYNIAISPSQRQKLERFFSDKYQVKLERFASTDTDPPIPENARNHWAYQPKRRPNIPTLKSEAAARLVRTPIDAFLLARLEEKQLTFAPEADAVTLFRRLHLDLTGLPPSIEEMNAFLNDSKPGKYEIAVDRLLASPHYGERWGRHWLDLAGYVDVLGNDQNAEQIILGESKWKYRDYVIKSFNADKPFDLFLREQIAGDELVDWRRAQKFTPDIEEKLVATGYLRLAIDDTHEVDLNKVPFRYQVVFDTVQLVGSSLFGMTLQCARCHDHKFDPVSQRDYYRFMGLFTPAFNPHSWLQPKDRELPDVSSSEQAEIRAHNAALEKQMAPVRDRSHAIRIAITNRIIEPRLQAVPESKRNEIKAAFHTPPEKRSPEQKALLKENEPALQISKEQFAQAQSPEEARELGQLDAQLASLQKSRKNWDTIRAFFETSAPPRNYIFVRGDHDRRGQRLDAGFPRILSDDPSPELSDQRVESTGRRLAFANWITKPTGRAAALTGRVIMNRFWQQLFGEGIVRTPDNFGINGMRPTHPELIEWLTAEFIESGWKIKPLLRTILLSSAYRQSSSGSFPTAEQADPENLLLWKMRLRRLESETIRDGILKVSGKLDPHMFGPAVPLITLQDGSIALPADEKLPTPTSKYRRSLYLMSRRNFHLPILGSFDQPIINNACARRMASSVVLQPLTMLNDAFVIEQSQAFASRIEALAGTVPESQIKAAFRLALSREPSPEEISWSVDFLEKQRKHFSAGESPAGSEKARALVAFSQMLLNTSEFLYIQ